MFVDVKRTSVNFMIKKCKHLFDNSQDQLINEEDYQWLGNCSTKIARSATEEEKTQYWQILKKANETNPPGTPNHGIFVSLLDHFKSLIIFPTEWYE